MGNIKKLLKVCLKPLSLLNRIVKKDKNSVFFYSNLGFRDNVKSLYDYMIQTGVNKTRKITVATDEFKKYKQSAPENVKFVSTKGGFFPFFKAKYCFYSFGKYPIKPAKEQIVVNLWHGMPLKAIGRFVKGCENEDQNFFSHIIATSPFFAKIMTKAFGADENQVVLTNQPRCDAFLKKSEKPEFLCDFDKVIFWLPTFMSSKRLGRTDGSYSEINPYHSDFLLKLHETLKEKNVLLIIKPHPMDDAVLSKIPFENILCITDEDLEKQGYTLYDILKFTDALVTDFSSIYIDFMLLDRPIAFAGADVGEYEKSRGFIHNEPKELMPGEIISNEEDFGKFIVGVSAGADPLKEKRQALNEIFNSCNGSGCQSLLKEIDF